MTWNAAAHEAWEMRELDGHLEGPDADVELVAPVYVIGQDTKETATGRLLTDEEGEQIMDKFCENLSYEEWRGAEKRAEYLVKTGVLK